MSFASRRGFDGEDLGDWRRNGVGRTNWARRGGDGKAEAPEGVVGIIEVLGHRDRQRVFGGDFEVAGGFEDGGLGRPVCPAIAQPQIAVGVSLLIARSNRKFLEGMLSGIFRLLEGGRGVLQGDFCDVHRQQV